MNVYCKNILSPAMFPIIQADFNNYCLAEID